MNTQILQSLKTKLSTHIFKERHGDFEHFYIFSRVVISISTVRGKKKLFIVIGARIQTEISIWFSFQGHRFWNRLCWQGRKNRFVFL